MNSVATKALNICIYTVLMGNYEQLNEQPVSRNSQVRFVCFTDDPDLTSDTWECRLIRPVFAMDPIRSQREIKLRPHLYLPEFDGSIYIDNSVILSEPPEALWALLPEGAGLLLPRHSFRDTVMDEFLEVSRLGLDEQTRIFEQLNHYALSYPETLRQAPFWNAILVRDHRHQQLRNMQEIWIAHVNRYSRRDQLSLNLALHLSGLEPAALDIDNLQSWFHRWPVTPGRDRERGPRNPISNLIPLAARVHGLEKQLCETGSRLALVEQACAEERRDHAVEVAALQERTETQCAQALADIQHQHAHELARTHAQHADALAERAREHDATVSEMQSTHLNQTRQLQARHDQAVAQHLTRHRVSLDALREQLAQRDAAIACLRGELDDMRRSSTWRAAAPIRHLAARYPRAARSVRRGLRFWKEAGPRDD